jgi:hypothetical protein
VTEAEKLEKQLTELNKLEAEEHVSLSELSLLFSSLLPLYGDYITMHSLASRPALPAGPSTDELTKANHTRNQRVRPTSSYLSFVYMICCFIVQVYLVLCVLCHHMNDRRRCTIHVWSSESSCRKASSSATASLRYRKCCNHKDSPS